MPTLSFYIDGNSATTFSLASTFTAYLDKDDNGTLYTWYTTPTTKTATRTFPTASIPAGSTINSALLSMDAGGSLYGGTEKHAGSTTQDNLDVKSLITAGANTDITYSFKSNTGGTGTYSGTARAGSATFSNMVLVIDYTAPYTACGAPSSVSVSPTTVDAGASATLSWSGASAGTNNAITAYQIYRSANGGAYSLLQTVATSATSGSVSVSAHTTMGSYYTYKIVTIGTVAGYNSGDSGTATLTSRVYTNCSAPSSVSVSLSTIDSGGSITLSWSGAAAGTNNPIAGYQIYHSTNNSTFTLYDTISTSATSGNKAITLTSSDDVTYYYRVYTIGTNTNFNSGASATVSVAVKTYTNCTAPTVVTVSSAIAEGDVTISWSGAAAGRNNPIANYKIQRQESADNTTWTAAADLTTTTATSLSVSAPSTRGNYYRYLVAAIGTKTGYNSGYTTGGNVRKNRLPSAPTIAFPVAGSKIYNPKPYVKVTVGSEPDAQNQTIKASNGTYTVSSASTYGAGSIVSLQFANNLSGSNTITVRGNDGLADGAAATAAITVLTPSWTDGTLSGVPIKAAHINELRAIVDDIRAYYGLPAYAWTDAPIVANETPVKVVHLTQLQNAMKECAAVRGATLSFTAITKNLRIRATHIQEMRDAVIQL